MRVAPRYSVLMLCTSLACSPNSSSPGGRTEADAGPVGSTSGAATAVDPVAAAAEIKALESRWSDLYGAGDLEGIVALMAEESVLIMPQSAPVVGLDAIREATRQMLESGDEVSWRSDFARVSPSGDMAYDYGAAITTRPDGATIEGHYLVVWVREDGEWKVAADMFN